MYRSLAGNLNFEQSEPRRVNTNLWCCCSRFSFHRLLVTCCSLGTLSNPGFWPPRACGLIFLCCRDPPPHYSLIYPLLGITLARIINSVIFNQRTPDGNLNKGLEQKRTVMCLGRNGSSVWLPCTAHTGELVFGSRPGKVAWVWNGEDLDY